MILVCIFNYRHDDNAKKLLNALNPYFETVVLDSGNDHVENDFIQFPNIYYSGLWNEMKRLSEKNDYRYVCQICSDVCIDDMNMELLIARMQDLENVNNIGIWQPASSEESRHNWSTRFNPHHRFTIPTVIEGWMSVISTDVLRNVDYVNTNINLYGYGIDIVLSVKSTEMNKLLVIDNSVQVYNPAGTGYDTYKAYVQGNEYLMMTLNKRLYDFTYQYSINFKESINGLQ